jgi:hypothetical protein
VLAMAPSRFTSTSFLYIAVLYVVAAQDSRLVHNGPIFERFRCPGNGVVYCGIGNSAGAYTNVTVGQCNAACNHIGGCSWFNFIDNDIEDGRGVCQLFDHQPQIGNISHCTLYKVRSVITVFLR